MIFLLFVFQFNVCLFSGIFLYLTHTNYPFLPPYLPSLFPSFPVFLPSHFPFLCITFYSPLPRLSLSPYTYLPFYSLYFSYLTFLTSPSHKPTTFSSFSTSSFSSSFTSKFFLSILPYIPSPSSSSLPPSLSPSVLFLSRETAVA